MMPVEILVIILVFSAIANIFLLVRVAVLRNNLSLFAERLKEIEKQLAPKHKKEVLNEQENG